MCHLYIPWSFEDAVLPTLTYLRDSHVLREKRQNCMYFSCILPISRIKENNEENIGIISEKHFKNRAKMP